ncbi:CAAX amino terminal protease self- immunity [Lacunisphaera limnophila]|uniref:CAAX amino terminal protease self-immunity n=1 Tax=Lacunisphaera limnophila TaxID=1838286 RepID=A0A1D8AR72_9BACT|nr:CPBP family intramembrane glutamic endopeptidase [Lacunisphaera limnophila]AOS43386.1 CAAX amino terminal protease self- immunity [Lacunisphaera limnophila]
MSPLSGRVPTAYPPLGPAVLLVLGVLFLQAAGGVLIMLLAAWAGGAMAAGTSALYNPWSLAVINTLAIGLILAAGLRGTGESFARFLIIRPFAPGQVPAVLLTAAGLAVVLGETDNLILELLQALGWTDGFSPDLIDLPGQPVGSFLLLVIVAPLTEEYFFRGLLLRGLLSRHRAPVAIGVTALLFGLVHANLRQLFLGAVIGAVFGWWYLRSRSLGPCLIGHAVFNALAWFALLFPSEWVPFTHNQPGTLIAHQPVWFTVSGILAVGLGLAWFARYPASPPPAPPTPDAEPLPPLLAPPPAPSA